MPASGFHTTSWTLIRTASGDPTPDSHEALAALCQKYWHPVYAFIRGRGYDPEQSQDLTQEFFALLIEKNYISEVDMVVSMGRVLNTPPINLSRISIPLRGVPRAIAAPGGRAPRIRRRFVGEIAGG